MAMNVQNLLARAFARAPAHEANAGIQRAREEVGENARSYEVVAAPDCGEEWLKTELLPRLVYHLESLGIRPPGYAGLFLSLFVGDELYFVHAQDAMAFAGAALSLTADEMYALWGTHELREPVRPAEDQPMLGLPPADPQ